MMDIFNTTDTIVTYCIIQMIVILVIGVAIFSISALKKLL